MDDDVAAHRREDLAEDDVEEAEIERPRGFDVVALLQREDLRPDLAEEARPLEERQDHREEHEARRPQDRRDRDEQDELRDREGDVGDRDDGGVQPPADDGRDRPEGDGDERREQRGDDRHREDVPAAVDDLVEHVLALEVRAQRMRERGRQVDVDEARVVLEWHEDGRHEGEQEKENDPEEADEAIKCKLRITRLIDGRDLGMSRRPHAVGRREHFDCVRLKLRTQCRERCFGHLDPARGDVVGRLLRVAVRDSRHVKIVFFEETCEEKIDGAGCACPIKLSRIRARHGNQISHRFNVHRRRNGNDDDCVPTAGDREKVAIVIRHLLQHVGMGGQR